MDDKAKLRNLQFKSVGNIFTTLAFSFAILFLFRSFSRSLLYLSPEFKIVGVFLHRLSILVLNHHFVFLLGNAIIVTLFFKFASDNQSSIDPNSSGNVEHLIGDVPLEAAIADENETIPVEREVDPVPESIICQNSWGGITDEAKRCSRSRSEDELGREKQDCNTMQLRRSGTQLRQKTENSQNERLEVDDLSNEEFQREVEAFIERQRRFLREESMAVVSA